MVMEKRVILVVDDVKLNLMSAKRALEDEYEVCIAQSAKEGLDILKNITPNLMLLDIYMPEMDGCEMLKIIKKNRRLRDIPVIFLTAEKASEREAQCFDLGAVDFIRKPFVDFVMKRRIATHIQLAEYNHRLEQLVEEKVYENERLQDMLSMGFAELVESRDGITGGHVKNTSIYFETFINVLKELPEYRDELTPKFVKYAIRSAPLHDIGKIGIDDCILRKQGELENDEMIYMKTHAQLGGETFKKIRKVYSDNEFLEIAEEMALYHHERWDGRGYPQGLKGEEIPLAARIMSVVDVYDALTSKRPYKEPFSHEKSMAIIVEGRGTQFDPKLVDIFVDISDKIKECLERKRQKNINNMIKEDRNE